MGDLGVHIDGCITIEFIMKMATNSNLSEYIQKGVKELEKEITCSVYHNHFKVGTQYYACCSPQASSSVAVGGT